MSAISQLARPYWHAGGIQSPREEVMRSTARLVLSVLLGLFAASSASAQITIQPTAAPAVTAETESWYLMNEPVFFAGNAYYPSGPALHFLPNEMVLSGLFRGIPLYTRTTIEPYSLVFLPIGGGMVRPYERRRSGDLAGTTGSSVPSFPVEIPMASSRSTPLQAAGPPFVETRGIVAESLPSGQIQLSRAAEPDTSTVESAPPLTGASSASGVGTGGRRPSTNAAKARTARPGDGIFVEFNNQRWYSSAPPTSLDTTTLRRVGDWHGFPVYASRRTGGSTIYIPIAQGSDAYAAYSRK
jgi:hypothetical protein